MYNSQGRGRLLAEKLIRRLYWLINQLFIAFTHDLSDLSSLSFPIIIKGKGDSSLDFA